MFESLFSSTTGENLTLHTTDTFICIGTALALGLFLSLIYLFSDRKRQTSANFAMTLVILPAIVAIVIMLIGSNVARAISLGGVFALVRFRSVAGDSKDISSIFFAMTIGLATGMGFPLFAAIVAGLIGVIYFILVFVGYGVSRSAKMLLKITVPENLNFNDAFDEVLNNYTKDTRLVKVKTTNLGSLYELTYEVILKNELQQKEFIDDLRCRNGNLNIILSQMPVAENVL